MTARNKEIQKMQWLKFSWKVFIMILCGLFTRPDDNYDFHRFPSLEKKESIKLHFKNKIIKIYFWLKYMGCLYLNMPKFFKAYQLLNDKESKELFIRLILYKILGWKHIKIKHDCGWSDIKKLFLSVEKFYVGLSEIAVKNHLHGNLNHYEHVPVGSKKITLDCWEGSIVYALLKKQYYFERNEIHIKPSIGDSIIDAGGGFGDTSIIFANEIGEHGKVYVFDPLPIHGAIIRKNIKQNQLKDQVFYFPYAVSECSNNIKFIGEFSQNLNPGFRLPDDSTFPITSIDDFIHNHGVNKVDFIKMDIEGHELSALKGAIRTLKKFKPKLAISIYHCNEDFYSIPLWITQALGGVYHFYIEHYTIYAEETILYAIAD